MNQAVIEERVPGAGLPPRPVVRGRNTFAGVVKSEWLKLRSLRSVRFTLGFTFLAGVGISTLGAIVMSEYGETVSGSDAGLSYLLNVMQPPIMFLALLFGALGVFAMSSEYSSGMILSTLAVTPKRGRVFGAKLLVVALTSLVTVLMTFGVGQAIALAFEPGAAAALTDTQYLTAWAGSVFFLVAMTVMSFGIAGLLRSTAGGIAVLAALTFVLPIAFSFAQMAGKAWIDWIMNHLPLVLGNTLSMGLYEIPAEFADLSLPWVEAGISTAVWALVFVIPALVLFLKRDAK